jgi:serine/threonine protein kinase
MDAESWRQAKGVLAEALLCPPAERGAFIDAHCADPELRREVHAFLAEYDEDFLESVRSVAGTLDSTSSTAGDAEQLPNIQAGDQVGPYVVVEQLGVGGMGHVYLGNDPRLHRRVALKCLSAAASANELRSRILHEARAAARINHPNIAIVHDVVEHENRPFLVMEYVEGENLAAVIKRGRPPIETIVGMMRQLASALAAAHSRGIVHRDLKPANIQVTPDGSVKILDFGVAHAMSAAVTASPASVDPRLTITVTTVAGETQGDRRVMHPGTPAYMSPEQMFGRPIDQRSDIYSLGVIVYEMATGHRPYATDDPLEIVLTLSKNFLKPDEPPTNIPAQINEIVTKMLAVRAEDRYQTAGELENALMPLTAPQALPLEAPSRWRSMLRTAGRVAAAAAFLSLGATVVGFIETQAFNLSLGRVAPFNQETPLAWLEYGLRSSFLPALYFVALLVFVRAVRFGVRVLSLSKGIDHLLTTGLARTNRLGSKLQLDDPSGLAQAVAMAGVVLIVVLVVRFYPFIHAFMTFSISTRPLELFQPLQPAGQARIDAQWYRFLLTLLVCGLGLAITRIQRLRSRQPLNRGGSSLALVLTMFAVAVLMLQIPYRTVWKNESPLLDIAGERCFGIGASADQSLIFCPDRPSPRNRTVRRDDPSVRDTGLRQNIFTPPETAH